MHKVHGIVKCIDKLDSLGECFAESYLRQEVEMHLGSKGKTGVKPDLPHYSFANLLPRKRSRNNEQNKHEQWNPSGSHSRIYFSIQALQRSSASALCSTHHS